MDRAVIATASELFQARHFPGVVALCSDALEDDPECLPLLLMRARAHMALRRDLDAQADLRDIIRLDRRCAVAYRLLGELAARRNENESAALLFREALRLDPGDREATDWLMIVDALLRPAAGATKLPAAASAAGRVGSPDDGGVSALRLARGTQPPGPASSAHGERPTQPLAAAYRREELRRAAVASAARSAAAPARAAASTATAASSAAGEPSTLPGRPPGQPPAKEAPRLSAPPAPPAQLIPHPAPASPRPTRTARMTLAELPGFDEYLVANGILTRDRLRAAQAYQRSMKVPLSTAIVTLGLATPQRIDGAVAAHRSQLAADPWPR